MKLPRTPAVFESKRRWALPGQRAIQGLAEDDTLGGAWNTNYESVAGREDAVEKKLWDLVDKEKSIASTA